MARRHRKFNPMRYVAPVFSGLILLMGCQPAAPTASPPSPAVDLSIPASPPPVSSEPIVKGPTTITPSTEGLGEYFDFPKVGIKLRLPHGLDRAKLFDGFHRPGVPVTVEMLHIKVPYDQFSKSLTTESLSLQGKNVHSREEILLNNNPGLLVHYEVPAGNSSNVSWALLTVADDRTIMVTAAVYQDVAPEWEMRLKNCILSVQPIPLEEAQPNVNTENKP